MCQGLESSRCKCGLWLSSTLKRGTGADCSLSNLSAFQTKPSTKKIKWADNLVIIPKLFMVWAVSALELMIYCGVNFLCGWGMTEVLGLKTHLHYPANTAGVTLLCFHSSQYQSMVEEMVRLEHLVVYFKRGIQNKCCWATC